MIDAIPIRNVYHMMAYAFDALNQNDYRDIDPEEFEDAEGLFATILSTGISRMLKQGMRREYVDRTESLTTLRGRLDFPGTISNRVQKRLELNCTFDELSEDNLCNRVLKTTATYLMNSDRVPNGQRGILRRQMVRFSNVGTVDLSTVRWDSIRYDRNSGNYRLLMSVCRFVADGMLMSTTGGRRRAVMLSEDRMSHLYERFILEYYRRHHPRLRANAEKVDWNLDEGCDHIGLHHLPHMKTDITLRDGERTLIIDAKYYTRSMQRNYDKHTYHSHNMYQIHTYVTNLDRGHTGNVGGMLLYAKTSENSAPTASFRMDGNMIAVRSLDLDADFKTISAQLDDIVGMFFGNGSGL